MAGKPWEKFKSADPPAKEAGPWDKFTSEKPIDLEKSFKEAGYKTAVPEFFNDALNAGTNFVDTALLENPRYSEKFRDAIDVAKRDSPKSSMAGKGLGMAALTAASMASPVGPLTTAAIQGVASKPTNSDTPGDDLVGRAVQGVAAPVVSTVLGAAGSASKKTGDYLMQKAMGMGKYIPEMGTRFANEGLWGSKGMMLKQVANKLPKREIDLDRAVKLVMGKVDPQPVEQSILKEAAPYIPKPGSSGPMPLPSGNKPFIDLTTQRAEEAMARGQLTPEEAVSVARAVSKPAYGRTGEPLDAFKHQVSQAEGIALKDQVKNLADKQGIPQVRKSLASEQALITARKALEKEEGLARSLARHFTNASIFGGGAAVATGSPAMAIPAYLASTPMGMSTLGQVTTKAGQVAPALTPAAIDALVRKAMAQPKEHE